MSDDGGGVAYTKSYATVDLIPGSPFAYYTRGGSVTFLIQEGLPSYDPNSLVITPGFAFRDEPFGGNPRVFRFTGQGPDGYPEEFEATVSAVTRSRIRGGR